MRAAACGAPPTQFICDTTAVTGTNTCIVGDLDLTMSASSLVLGTNLYFRWVLHSASHRPPLVLNEHADTCSYGGEPSWPRVCELGPHVHGGG